MTTTEVQDLYRKEYALPPLTREQEQTLFARRQLCDDEERRRLDDLIVRSNMGFCAREAHAWRYRGDYESLRRAAVRGMYEALRRFDPSRGHKFISYAVHWIRQAMRAELVTQGKWVTWPVSLTAARVALGKRSSSAAIDASTEESVAALGLGQREEAELLAYIRGPYRLDGTGDDSQRPSAEVIMAPETPEDDGWATTMDDPAAAITASLGAVDERSRWIITRYFGLDGQGTATLFQIGRDLGITRERTRQLRDKALAALREAMLASNCGDLAEAVRALAAPRHHAAPTPMEAN